MKAANLNEIAAIVASFEITGGFSDAVPFGSGHINDTYRIANSNADAPDYVLQRVNHDIFKDVPALIDNIINVTDHLRNKFITPISGTKTGDRALTLIAAKSGKYYYQDAKGQYWRLYLFLPDTRSYDVVTTRQQAYEGGKALGQFQNYLADLDVSKLSVVLPDFHNVNFRLRQFAGAVQNNAAGRLDEVAAEVAFVREREHDMGEIERLGEAGRLPLRVTHNDTKFNNILFDANDRAQCIIDLDTIMPGYMAFDFGDAVRTLINTAPEDEPDLEKIQLNMPVFKAFAQGFLGQTASYMSTTELRSLILGITALPFIMGLRFLTDYINGDTYYKTAFPTHNLQRARAQFNLAEKLEQAHAELYAIVMHAAEVGMGHAHARSNEFEG